MIPGVLEHIARCTAISATTFATSERGAAAEADHGICFVRTVRVRARARLGCDRCPERQRNRRFIGE